LQEAGIYPASYSGFNEKTSSDKKKTKKETPEEFYTQRGHTSK
jgi:hypothetical protein